VNAKCETQLQRWKCGTGKCITSAAKLFYSPACCFTCSLPLLSLVPHFLVEYFPFLHSQTQHRRGKGHRPKCPQVAVCVVQYHSSFPLSIFYISKARQQVRISNSLRGLLLSWLISKSRKHKIILTSDENMVKNKLVWETLAFQMHIFLRLTFNLDL